MQRKRTSLLVVSLVVIGAVEVCMAVLPNTAVATTLYVGGGGPGNFTSIQDAVSAAVAGDIVFVYNGTYNEHITITKTISLVGEDRDTTVIDGGGVGDVIYIFAHWVNVSGFTVRNGGPGVPGSDAGIEVHGVRNASVTNNIVTGNLEFGIYVDSSIDTLIADNVVASNSGGIHLISGQKATVVNNSVYSHIAHGIRIYMSNLNTILNNNITSNGGKGVILQGVTSGNLIYHNSIVGNAGEAYDSSANAFDNGYPEGGNFWGDYSGTDVMCGPAQDFPGSDGIGDTAYIIDGDSRDRYPLMSPTFPLPSHPPSAPATPNAEGGDQEINLTWNAPVFDGRSPITNYRIYRGYSSGSETFLTELGDVLMYTDTGLTNGQTHYYQVSAVNALGESAKSEEVSGVPATLPGAPESFFAIRGDQKVDLEWSPPIYSGGIPVTGYVLYRGTSSGSQSYLMTLGNVTTHTDTGLTNGITYYYLVAAVNNMGEGPNSTEISATPATIPSAPQDFQSTEGNQEVVLTWSAPADSGGLWVTNFRIYRGATSGNLALLNEIGNVTTYTDTGLTNGMKYYYQVSAVNEVGEGSGSVEVSATPATVPSAPTDFVAEGRNGEVKLTWTVPSDNGGSPITNFTVYRGTASGGETLLVVLGIAWEYLDTGLSNGVSFYYKVTAVNRMGEGPMSIEASATPATYPSEPLNLQAVPGDRNVTLSWEPPNSDGGLPISGYRIYRGTAPGTGSFLVEIGSILSHTDTNLTNGVTYYYRIKAVNGYGESSKSNEANSTPFNKLPTCDISFPTENSEIAGTITISGVSSDPDGAVQRVEVKVDDGSWTQAQGDSTWTYSWDTTKTSNGPHTISVRSYDGGDYSAEASVSVLVNNPESGGAGLPMLAMGILVLIVVVVIAAVAILMFLRKRKVSEKEPPDEGS